MRKLASVLLVLTLLSTYLPSSALAATAPNANGLDPAAYLDLDGTLNIPENFSGSFDLRGWDVRLHPSKGVVFSPPQATAGQWSSLGGAGTGLSSTVYDIEFSGGVLYAGGSFSDAGGDADADFIAMFSGGAWSSLGGAGTGLNSVVLDIEFNGGVLYAGGNFTDAGGDADADFIAMFSSGAWSSLGGAGTGLDSAVRDIEFNGGVLYAGGFFSDAGGDADADFIAQFSGGAWSSLGGAGTGLSGGVFDIELNGGVLYVGGSFTDAGGDADADFIAQFGLSVGGGAEEAEEGQKCSQEINSSGTTIIICGRIRVSVPESAIPDGETNCRIVIKEAGDSGDYGFSLDDKVWDVKIICDSGEVNIFFTAITVCIRPKDGVTTNKSVFHNHGGGFAAIAGGVGPSGYVCGSTNLLSLFTLGQFALPDTGFAPGEVTQLLAQPEASQYFEYDALTLEIPQLNVVMPIWGVPQSENGWDVSWLGENAGYLYGTAYPTWVGNSLLTAHVWNADNSAGPFFHLRDLQHGDQFYVHSGDQTYVYEVRTNRLVSEKNLSVMKDSAYSLITLITCESFSENTGEYLYRRAVQAVLISVQ